MIENFISLLFDWHTEIRSHESAVQNGGIAGDTVKKLGVFSDLVGSNGNGAKGGVT